MEEMEEMRRANRKEEVWRIYGRRKLPVKKNTAISLCWSLQRVFTQRGHRLMTFIWISAHQKYKIVLPGNVVVSLTN